MTKLKRILLIVALTGVLILLLPDKGKPIIVFSKVHGPSFLDMIGLALISVSWLAGVFMIVQNWNGIKKSIGVNNIALCLILYLISCFGIAAAIKIGSDWILWLCAIIALLINILFVYFAFAKK